MCLNIMFQEFSTLINTMAKTLSEVDDGICEQWQALCFGPLFRVKGNG